MPRSTKKTTRRASKKKTRSPKRKTSTRKKTSSKRKITMIRKKTSSKRKTSTTRKKTSIDKLRRKPAGVPNKPWKQLTSMSRADRKTMPMSCFLDQENRKYPICYNRGRRPSCVGLEAAERRATMLHNRSIVKKSRTMQRHIGCNKQGGDWKYREAELYKESQRKH